MRSILMPDVTTFGELLEYHGEWPAWKGAARLTEPRYLTLGIDGIGATMRALTAMGGFSSDPRARNEIGPFCTVDLSQIGGLQHRSIAVRATDAAMEAVAPRIVTDDDHLSFKIIAHAGTDRALVILQHSQIIGSHWLAYIDPASIPAYPFAARDERFKSVCDAIREAGGSPYVTELEDFAREVRPMIGASPFDRRPDPARRAVIFKDGSSEETWPGTDTATGEHWKTRTEAPR